MPAAIYCRVSSKGQAENGASLETQERECRGYCERMGLPIFKVYSDTASAGSLDRPALDSLRDDIGAGLITHVVALAWDRVSRDVGSQIVLLSDLQAKAIELHFVQGGKYDPESDEGELLSTVLAASNQYMRRRIQDRTRRGRLGKVRRGKVSLSYLAPFGYRLIGEKKDGLEIVPAEAKTVKRIFEAYAKDPMASLTSLARLLEKEGRPTPAQMGHCPRGFQHRKAAGVWNESTLRLIITNRLYGHGTWTYRRSRVQRNGNRIITAPEDRVVVTGLPTIVEPRLQDAALRRLEANRWRRMGKRKAVYNLAGFIRCGECGLSWTGFSTHIGGKRYSYYRCSGKLWKNSLDGKTRRCTMPNRTTQEAEEVVLDQIRKYAKQISKPAVLDRAAAEIVEEIRQKRSGRDFEAELADIEAKRSRLLAALDATGPGESAKAIGAKLGALDTEAARIRRDQNEDSQVERVQMTLKEVRKTLQDLPEMMTVDHLPGLLEELGAVITVRTAPELKVRTLLEITVGTNLQTGVPVCLTVKPEPIYLDRGSW